MDVVVGVCGAFGVVVENALGVHHDAQEEHELHHHSCGGFEYHTVECAREGGGYLLVLFAGFTGACGKVVRVCGVHHIQECVKIAQFKVVGEEQGLVEPCDTLFQFGAFL